MNTSQTKLQQLDRTQVSLLPEDLLTAEEVAGLLRVTTGWVYAQTRLRRIPHLRLGRYVRYRRAALEAWMAEVESTPSTQVRRLGRRP